MEKIAFRKYGCSTWVNNFTAIITIKLTDLVDSFIWVKLDLSPSESYKLLAHSSTQVGSYLFIQGGHDGAEYISDMRFFNLGNIWSVGFSTYPLISCFL